MYAHFGSGCGVVGGRVWIVSGSAQKSHINKNRPAHSVVAGPLLFFPVAVRVLTELRGLKSKRVLPLRYSSLSAKPLAVIHGAKVMVPRSSSCPWRGPLTSVVFSLPVVTHFTLLRAPPLRSEAAECDSFRRRTCAVWETLKIPPRQKGLICLMVSDAAALTTLRCGGVPMSSWTFDKWKVFQAKKCLFFFSHCSKAEQRESGTAATIGLCVPIILCSLLSYIDLAVARFKSGSFFCRYVLRNEKKKRWQTDKKKTICRYTFFFF